jgi:hypothetical protein
MISKNKVFKFRNMKILRFKNRLSLLIKILKYKIIKLVKSLKFKKFCKEKKRLIKIFKEMIKKNKQLNKK